MFSIILGAVRLHTAETWEEAKQKAHGYLTNLESRVSFPNHNLSIRQDMERLATTEECDAYHVTGKWANTLLFIQCGKAGLTDGDLAIIHDHRGWPPHDTWTVDVRCKVLRVLPDVSKAVVRVTGKSLQLIKGEEIKIPVLFLQRR